MKESRLKDMLVNRPKKNNKETSRKTAKYKNKSQNDLAQKEQVLSRRASSLEKNNKKKSQYDQI